MRRLKIFEAVLIFSAALFALSGCSTIEMDTEALMLPPQLTEEQALLHSALTKVAGANYRLVYPKMEDTRSAFIFRDLDGDGEEEAMVFYVSEAAENDTRLNILKKRDGVWNSVYEAPPSGSEVESVHFANMENDDVIIVIGWIVSGGSKEAALYRFRDNRLDTLFSGPYQELGILDMDGDRHDDIVFFGGRGSSAASVSMISSKGGKIKEYDEIAMTAAPSAFISVLEGKLTSSRTALFVDSRLSEEAYVTEVIAYRDGALVCLVAEPAPEEDGESVPSPENDRPKPAVDTSNMLTPPPERRTPVLCRDIDGDGITEIPIQSLLPGVPEEADSDRTPLTVYQRFDGESFVGVWSGVVDVENKYAFRFPESWLGVANVMKFPQYNEWRFYAWLPNEEGEVEEEALPELLRIKVTSANDYQDRFEEDYQLLGKRGLTTFYGYISAGENSPFAITKEECAASFLMLD